MRRWLGWIAIGWLLALCAVGLALYGTGRSTPSLADQTRALAGQLRCLQCQGETVADSQATFSVQVRALIRHDLQAGQSPASIKSYLVSRYGDRILLAPPVSGVGTVAWVGPPLLVLAGIGFLLTLVLDWRTRGRGTPTTSGEAYLDRVRAELAMEDVGE